MLVATLPFVSRFSLACRLVTLAAVSFCSTATLAAQEEFGHALHGEQISSERIDKIQQELQFLLHPSYTRRLLAKQRLLEFGADAIPLVQPMLDSQKLETRLSARELLDGLRQQQRERELNRLFANDPDQPAPNLPCWQSFASAAGDTPQSRELFARLIRKHGDALTWLARIDDCSADARETAYLEMDRYLPLDIGRMNAGDPVRWTLLLLASQNSSLVNAPILSSRVRGGLLNPQVSTRLKNCAYASTLKSLVASWLQASSQNFVNSTTLRISLVYDCREQAEQLTELLLEDQGSSPASIATSLMILARIDPKLAQLECLKRLDDQRVCHVWQVVSVRHRAVQTEVRDVAMAMLLYLSGHDPRQFGFEDIEGDPETIYRDFSMGFENEEARLAAFKSCRKELGAFFEDQVLGSE